jgi:hypothetical protein
MFPPAQRKRKALKQHDNGKQATRRKEFAMAGVTKQGVVIVFCFVFL